MVAVAVREEGGMCLLLLVLSTKGSLSSCRLRFFQGVRKDRKPPPPPPAWDSLAALLSLICWREAERERPSSGVWKVGLFMVLFVLILFDW